MAALTPVVLAIQVAISIPGVPLSALVLSFMVYGFAGWLWESTVCAMLNHGSFANSGFLLGPCCPIYGVGALVCWFALRGIESARRLIPQESGGGQRTGIEVFLRHI